MPTQFKMAETDKKFKVSIRTQEGGNGAAPRQGRYSVEAPLPDEFGLTVGSAFSTPFDTTNISETLQKLAAIGNISQKAGTVMNKVFTNPEPTEISFDLNFDAYYSARQEVLVPVFTLLMMSVGKTVTSGDLVAKTRSVIEQIAGGLGEVGVDASTAKQNALETTEQIGASAGNNQYVTNALELINFVEGPDKVVVEFGNAYEIRDAFIGSAGVRFSNKLDKDGIPMSAVVSVTLILESPPTKTSLIQWFGDIAVNNL